LFLFTAHPLEGAITIDLSLARLFPHRNPVVTCGITVVGYRFLGKPGQFFVYAGETFTVEDEGVVELLADRREKYFSCARVKIPLQEAPLDPFGFVDVNLPRPDMKK